MPSDFVDCSSSFLLQFLNFGIPTTFHWRWNMFPWNTELCHNFEQYQLPCECLIQQFSVLLKSSTLMRRFWLFIYMSDSSFTKMGLYLIYFWIPYILSEYGVCIGNQKVKKKQILVLIIGQSISNFCLSQLFYYSLNHRTHSMNTPCYFSSLF